MFRHKQPFLYRRDGADARQARYRQGAHGGTGNGKTEKGNGGRGATRRNGSGNLCVDCRYHVGVSEQVIGAELIHVVFEEDTRFYLKDTDENEEGHGNKEAGFQDLKEHMCVEMKGSFKNDEFHATEIRFF